MPRSSHAYHSEASATVPNYKLAVNQKPSAENVELYNAAKRGDLRSVRAALSAGANPNFYKLPEEGATPLIAAAGGGHLDTMTALLQGGAAIDERLITSQNGALHVAAGAGLLEATDLLLEHGAPLNTGNAFGNSPLMAALVGAHHKVAALLVERGAELAWVNNKGSTPLHFACYAAAGDAVKCDLCAMLLKAGADVNASDEDGVTPLMVAARDGTSSLVRLLLEKGADRSLADGQGHDAAFWARFKGHDEVVPLLAAVATAAPSRRK